MSSSQLSTTISNTQSIQSFNKVKTTKLFIIENNNKETLSLLKNKFSKDEIELNENENFIYTFKDKQSKSAIIIINIKTLSFLKQALNQLSNQKYIELEKLTIIN
jgi:hypothetical protein